jgi:hypothetical protein
MRKNGRRGGTPGADWAAKLDEGSELTGGGEASDIANSNRFVFHLKRFRHDILK